MPWRELELWTQFSFWPLMDQGTLQCVFEGDWREGTEKGQCSGGGKAQTIQYKIGSSHIIQHREYSQYFAVTVNGK